MPSELPSSTHLPTSEGWKAELAVGLWLVVPTTGLEPTRVDSTKFETLRLNHSATPLSPTVFAFSLENALKEARNQQDCASSRIRYQLDTEHPFIWSTAKNA